MYSYQAGRFSKNAIGSISDASAANGGKMVTGGTSAIQAMSASSFYEINKLGDNVTDYTTIDTEKRLIKVSNSLASSQAALGHAEINPVYNEFFANPETGELTGYTYESMISETFAFKIVGEGPITFEMADPYNDEIGGFEAGLYIASKAEGLLLCDITTYAPNFIADGSSVVVGDVEQEGSRKMTFFGENVHNAPVEPDQYTVKFVNAAGVTVSEQAYDAGTAAADVVVPANTAATSNDDGHTTYTWPAVADVTADATYN